MTLLIMAAGMGSRFGGLKQIEPIGPNGEFIIDYSVYDAKLAGFNKVVFIIKEENYEIFKETIGKRFDGIIEVNYVFQRITDVPSFVNIGDREKPWGTAHAILSAKDVIKEKFAVINADDFYDRDAYFKAYEFLNNSNENEYAIIGYKAGNTITEAGSVKRGVLEVKDSCLVKLTESVIEKKDNIFTASPLNRSESFTISFDTLVSMNMFGFSPKLFEHIEKGMNKFFKDNENNLEKCEYLIPDVVNKLNEEGEVSVKVIPTTSIWMGMTYREDKELLVNMIDKFIKDGTYPSKLS